MDRDKFSPINVLSIFRGFQKPGLHYQITPFRFELSNGKTHRIQQIRQMHRERVGKGFHYHYVVRTQEQAYFHLVFDTSELVWRLIQEVDDELFFNN